MNAYKNFIESGSYEQQKAVINAEANSLKRVNGYAAISIGNPGRLHRADYSVFKKDMDERMKLFTLKKQCAKKAKLTLIGRYEF